MKPLMILCLFACMFVLPAAAGADIYSWADAQGVRHFSNISPPVDAEDLTVVPSLVEPDSPDVQAGIDSTGIVSADAQQSVASETDEVGAPEPALPSAIAEPEFEDYIEKPEPIDGKSDIYGAVHRYYDIYPAGLIVYTGGSRRGYSGYRYSHRYPRHSYKHHSRGRHYHKYKYRYRGHGKHLYKYKHRYDGHRRYSDRHRYHLDDRGYRYKHRPYKFDHYKGRHHKPYYYRGKGHYRDRYYRFGGHSRYGFSGGHGYRSRGGSGARIYIGK